MVINSHRPKITNRVIKLALTCDTLLSSQVTGAHQQSVLAGGNWGRILTLQIFDCEVKSAPRMTFRFRILGRFHETGLSVRYSCGKIKHRGWPLMALTGGGSLRDTSLNLSSCNYRTNPLAAILFPAWITRAPLGFHFAAWPKRSYTKSMGLTQRTMSTAGAPIYYSQLPRQFYAESRSYRLNGA